MKKTIIFSLLLILFLTACTKKQVDEVISAIPFIGGDEEINEAVLKKDVELCKKLSGKDALAQLRRQNRCVEKVAKASSNYLACYLIKDVDDPDEVDYKAGNECAIAVAVETAELGACEEIERKGFGAEKCYAKLAPVLKDATLCAKVGEGTIWNNCIKDTAKAAENIAICDNFEASGLKGSCQADVARVKEDASLCERIEREDYKNNCYKNIAVKTKDTSLCDNMSTDSRKEQCRKSVEPINQKKQ